MYSGTGHVQIQVLTSSAYRQSTIFTPVTRSFQTIVPPHTTLSLPFCNFWFIPHVPHSKLYNPEMLFPAPRNAIHPHRPPLPSLQGTLPLIHGAECHLQPMGLRLPWYSPGSGCVSEGVNRAPPVTLVPLCSFRCVEMCLLSSNLTIYFCKGELEVHNLLSKLLQTFPK